MQKPVKEALPLPLFVICDLEAALSSAPAEDQWLIGGFLFMVWCSLRFSDVQRLELSSVRIIDSTLRGWWWRTKTSTCGFPWGCWLAGAAGLQWGHIFGQLLQEASVRSPNRGYLFGSDKGPMRYACILAQFRRCLHLYISLEPSQIILFTLHSMKVSCLSWGLQLEVDAEKRAAQGHHRLVTMTNSVVKYRRDDILPALKCQRTILQQIAQGWAPYTPCCRGADPVQEKRPRLVGHEALATERDSDAESETSGSCFSVFTDADDEFMSDASSLAPDGFPSDEHGPWILNVRSGWFHKAMENEVDDRGVWLGDRQLVLAGRPALCLSASYEARDTDPELEGYAECAQTCN